MEDAFEPYVGPKPFEEKDKGKFFGRNREASEILSLAVSNPVVVLYSQSGAGKTSLLNAKLIPMLDEEKFQVFSRARVQGVDYEEASNIFVFNSLLFWAKANADREALAQSSFVSFLEKIEHHKSPAPESWELPRFIIFDQFEELFTSYQHRWKDRQDFFEKVRDALRKDPLLRVIFAMREDYIAELDPYASILPDKLRTRFRLERLRERSALQAVIEPVKATDCHFAPGVAEQLVKNMLRIANPRNDDTREIIGEFVEPVQLQVVCENLWNGLQENNEKVITHEHLEAYGDVERALFSFYERCIETVIETGKKQKPDVKEGKLRRWFENTLITPDNTRGTVRREGMQTGGIPNWVVDLLDQQLHIIREERRGISRWYELTHDRLIPPIQKSNQDWRNKRAGAEDTRKRLEDRAAEWVKSGRQPALLLDEATLLQAEDWLSKEDAEELGHSEALGELVRESRAALKSATLKRRVKRMRWGMTGLAMLVILTIGMSIFAFAQKARAEEASAEAVKQRNDAIQAREESEKQRRLADDARAEAVQERDVAQVARADADKQKKRAEQALAQEAIQRKEVEKQRNAAIQAKEESDRQRQLAEQAALDAEAARKEEVIQREKAEAAMEVAQSRRLSGDAMTQLESNPELSVLLSLEAIKFSETRQAQDTLRSALANISTLRATLRGHSDVITDAIFTGDSTVRSVSMDRTVRAWDAATGKQQKEESIGVGFTNVIFSPDGKYIVATGEDDIGRVFDLDTGRSVADILAHQGLSRGIYFSNNGKYTASIHSSRSIYVGQILPVTAPSKAKVSIQDWTLIINSIAITNDGNLMVVAGYDSPSVTSNGSARVVETSTGKVIADLREIPAPLTDVVFSNDERLIIASCQDGTARIWETKEWKLRMVLQGHTGAVRSARFSPDDLTIVTAAEDNTARVWNAIQGDTIAVLRGHTRPLTSASFSADGKLVVTASEDSTLRVWDVKGQPQNDLVATRDPVRLRRANDTVKHAEFSPDGKLGLSVYSASLDLWDAVTGGSLWTLAGLGASTRATFSDDSRYVLISRTDGTEMNVYEASTRTILEVLGYQRVFSPDRKYVLIIKANGEVRIEHNQTGQGVTLAAQDSLPVSTAAFSPNSRQVITLSLNGIVRVWDVETGKQLISAKAQKNVPRLKITGAAFSPDGRHVVIPQEDYTVKIYDLRNSNVVVLLQGHQREVLSAGFSPDGELILTTSADGTARVWSIKSGAETFAFKDGQVLDASFSPDSQFIVTAQSDNTARVWKAKTGQETAVLRGHTGSVRTAEFSSDGKRILTTSEDGSANIYSIAGAFATLDDLRTIASKLVTRQLTAEERKQYLQ